jgi:tRNA/tmRNA/rRNA uracil-C5-methylase (TrmA/RlmC/RlmD family)
LPGETVVVDVVEKRSKLWFARTVEVVEASPDRIDHIWPLAAATGVGGADLGHVRLAAQRAWKADVVAQQLRRMAHLEWSGAVAAAPGDDARGGLGWRTRLSFAVDGDGRLAMHAPYSARLVAVDSMPLAHEAIVAAAPWEGSYEPGERVEVVWPSGGGGVVVCRSAAATGARGEVDVPSVCEILRCAQNDKETEWRLAATGFWQVHRAAPAVLVKEVLTQVLAAEPRGPVLDLYAGAGLFSVALADALDGAKVVAVEGDLTAAGWLARNLQPYPRATAVHGDVRRVLAEGRAVPKKAGVVVLDPPRAGAGRDVVAAIAGLGPRTVVYVACDPAALARDIALFAGHGYALAGLNAFDLFPHTHHVECVARLARA